MSKSQTRVTSVAFEKVNDHERIAYRAVMTVHRNGGNEVIFAAPNLDALERIWDKWENDHDAPSLKTPLDRERCQRVLIIQDKT